MPAPKVEMIADWRPFAATQTVVGVEVSADAVSVTWSDGRVSPFHLGSGCAIIALAPCACALTREQVYEVADAPEDLAATHVSVDGGLDVLWSDGHASRYAAGWLRANACDHVSRAERAPPPKTLWGAERTDDLPTFVFDEIESDPQTFLAWLTAIRDVGLTLVRGVPTRPEAVAALARRIAFVRETNFGVVFDVQSKPRPDSNAYTAINLPPHTDLPTRELQPGLQFLHCLVNETVGGDSIFVDGFALARALREDHPEDFETLATTPLAFWNKDAGSDYRWSAPIIALDGAGEVVEVRFANFLRGPIDAPFEAMAGLYRAYRRFIGLTRDPALRVVLRLVARRPVGASTIAASCTLRPPSTRPPGARATCKGCYSRPPTN